MDNNFSINTDSIKFAEELTHEIDLQETLDDKDKDEESPDDTRQKLRNKYLEDTIQQRKDYALWTFVLICVYLTAIFVLVLFNGCICDFNLSDAVMITLLGTTTATVLGLFLCVMHNLFPSKDIINGHQ